MIPIDRTDSALPILPGSKAQPAKAKTDEKSQSFSQELAHTKKQPNKEGGSASKSEPENLTQEDTPPAPVVSRSHLSQLEWTQAEPPASALIEQTADIEPQADVTPEPDRTVPALDAQIMTPAVVTSPQVAAPVSAETGEGPAVVIPPKDMAQDAPQTVLDDELSPSAPRTVAVDTTVVPDTPKPARADVSDAPNATESPKMADVPVVKESRLSPIAPSDPVTQQAQLPADKAVKEVRADVAPVAASPILARQQSKLAPENEDMKLKIGTDKADIAPKAERPDRELPMAADPPRQAPGPSAPVHRVAPSVDPVAVAAATTPDISMDASADLVIEEFEMTRASDTALLRDRPSLAALGVQTKAEMGPAAARQVFAQMSAALNQLDDGMLEIKLNPVELGRIIIQIAEGGFGQSANILAEKPEVLELLRRNENLLASEFADAGFDDLNFSFSQQDQDQDDDAAPFASETLLTTAAAQSTFIDQPLDRSRADLDIRL